MVGVVEERFVVGACELFGGFCEVGVWRPRCRCREWPYEPDRTCESEGERNWKWKIEMELECWRDGPVERLEGRCMGF